MRTARDRASHFPCRVMAYIAISISLFESLEMSCPVPPSTLMNSSASGTLGTPNYLDIRQGGRFFLGPLQRTEVTEKRSVL